jgi:hypothetical protein
MTRLPHIHTGRIYRAQTPTGGARRKWTPAGWLAALLLVVLAVEALSGLGGGSSAPPESPVAFSPVVVVGPVPDREAAESPTVEPPPAGDPAGPGGQPVPD